MCWAVFFFASFCFAVSACLVKKMLCSYSTCLLRLCSTDKMKSWFACCPVSSCSPFFMQESVMFLCKMDLVSVVFSTVAQTRRL